MEKNNSENIFYSYPKSNNHKILFKKGDNISVCDLEQNCSKLNFSISKNKSSNIKIFNDIKSDTEKFTCINCVYNNLNLLDIQPYYYDIVLFSLIILLFIVLKFIGKNN